MKHWFIVGLDKDGCELARATVTEDKVDKAVQLFKDFSDWVEVVDPEGKIAPRTAWTRTN